MQCFYAAIFSTIADDEKNGTHCPVNGHGNPDTQNAHAHSDSNNIAEGNTEHPHGDNRQNHAELYITGGTQRVRQRERFGPDEHTADTMIPDNLFCKGHCVIGKVIQVHDAGQRHKRGDAETIIRICTSFRILRV